MEEKQSNHGHNFILHSDTGCLC